ncbi:hypothetical protein [Lewinella sp. W8]|uniref:hypothetical protein n=1 Tax=Lewinella sp. W8 TaxID=2528208 RepID=UPI0010689435|nr:hypothetical protein [Lewinella sp. W8]MTB50503.1 hypothetical protein [Lewinella sp. W8]
MRFFLLLLIFIIACSCEKESTAVSAELPQEFASWIANDSGMSEAIQERSTDKGLSDQAALEITHDLVAHPVFRGYINQATDPEQSGDDGLENFLYKTTDALHAEITSDYRAVRKNSDTPCYDALMEERRILMEDWLRSPYDMWTYIVNYALTWTHYQQCMRENYPEE